MTTSVTMKHVVLAGKFAEVELLLREIPAKAEDPKAFHCFSNCVKAWK